MHEEIAAVFRIFCILLATLLPCGCRNASSGQSFSLSDKSQTAVFCIKLGWPVDTIVDSSGRDIRMPDGLQIVFDGATFEKQVLPLLGPQDKDSPQKYVAVDADFRMQQESVVTGVVQNEDGSGEETSRAFWVLRTSAVHSANWMHQPQLNP